MQFDKIIVVKKKTGLEELLGRFFTTSQIKFYLESQGSSYDYYLQAHETYRNGLEIAMSGLPRTMRSQVVDKDNLASFQFAERDLVAVVGGDGLLINAAKYIGNQPVISVNPDLDRYDGVLATCDCKDFKRILYGVLDDKYKVDKLTMAQACLNDGQVIYAINDLFIGRKTHVSARYMIEFEGMKEYHSSSGIIVCTGTGSTGWMKSIVIGANAIAKGESVLSDEVPYSRTSDYLLFAVREPFPTKVTGTSIVFGDIGPGNSLRITSNMPDSGVIFSDGIESDYLEFNSGRVATITPSERKVHLVVGVG